MEAVLPVALASLKPATVSLFEPVRFVAPVCVTAVCVPGSVVVIAALFRLTLPICDPFDSDPTPEPLVFAEARARLSPPYAVGSEALAAERPWVSVTLPAEFYAANVFCWFNNCCCDPVIVALLPSVVEPAVFATRILLERPELT